MNTQTLELEIYCPNCDNETRLQFLPMHNGVVYGNCPCGYCWELEKTRKELVN